MSDYTPAKPIVPGCLALLIGGLHQGRVVTVIEQITPENLDANQHPDDIGEWRYDIPHYDGGWWCVIQQHLLRIDDDGEIEREETKRKVEA